MFVKKKGRPEGRPLKLVKAGPAYIMAPIPPMPPISGMAGAAAAAGAGLSATIASVVISRQATDAASVAGLLITTEAMVADKPEPKGAAAPAMPDMGGMGGMM